MTWQQWFFVALLPLCAWVIASTIAGHRRDNQARGEVLRRHYARRAEGTVWDDD